MPFIEKYSIKIQLGIAVVVLLTVIGFTTQVGAKLQENNMTHEDLTETVKSNSEDINKLQTEAQQRALDIIEIKTKLANIEAMTLEIKQRLNK